MSLVYILLDADGDRGQTKTMMGGEGVCVLNTHCIVPLSVYINMPLIINIAGVLACETATDMGLCFGEMHKSQTVWAMLAEFCCFHGKKASNAVCGVGLGGTLSVSVVGAGRSYSQSIFLLVIDVLFDKFMTVRLDLSEEETD